MDRRKENGIITPHYVSGCQLCKMRRGLGRRRGLCGPPLHSMPPIKGERVSRHLELNYLASDSGARLPTFQGKPPPFPLGRGDRRAAFRELISPSAGLFWPVSERLLSAAGAHGGRLQAPGRN